MIDGKWLIGLRERVVSKKTNLVRGHGHSVWCAININVSPYMY